MRILVSFSGGKDSQACLIQTAKQYGVDKIEAVFCDTGWEHPGTYQHITDVCLQMGVKLITLKSKFDFVSLAKYKKRFPATTTRFCTEELKIKPMIDYVLSLDDSCIIIQGIRSAESASRAAMEEECMYFKYYFEPLETNTTRIEKLQRKLSKTTNFKKRVDIEVKIQKLRARLAKGKEDPKYYTYRKEDVFEYCKKYDASVSRPIKEKTAQEVIDIILNAGQKPNPLYYKGCKRVGCYPCMMCQLLEVKILMKEEDQKQKILDAESVVGTNFFPPGYIPKYACSNGKYPSAEDVFKYVSDKNATLDMYEPEGGYACMSLFHGLCE